MTYDNAARRGRRKILARGLALALVGLVASAVVRGAESPPLERFVGRLAKAGRAEAVVVRTAVDPLSGRSTPVRGRLAIEPPDRLSVRFGTSGERLTLRGDGGEWLQPRLRQMLTLGPERATAAARAWRVLLGDAEEGGLRFEPLGGRRWRVTFPGAEAAPEPGVLTLDARGFPARLQIDDGTGPSVVTFAEWRFVPARGRTDFVAKAPAGYEVVPLP